MTRYLFLFFFTICATLTHAQNIPSNRIVNWNQAALDGITYPNTILDITTFGGLGNGIAKNDAAIRLAIAAAPTSGAIIFFPTGIYLFDSVINVPSNIVIRGDGSNNTQLKYDGLTDDHFIVATGNYVGSSVNITNDCLFKLNTLTVTNASGFAVDDYIRLSENDSSIMFSTWAYGSTGQVMRISAVTGNTITVAGEFRKDYLLANSPKIIKVEPVKNIGIECLKIERLDATIGQSSNIYFTRAVNSWVKGIESDKTNFAHVILQESYHCEVFQSWFHHAHAYGGGGQGYGVVTQYATSECLINNNIFNHLRHSMLLQAGANGNVFAYNYSTDPYWTQGLFPTNSAGDLVLHGNYAYANLFEGNIVSQMIVDNSHGANGSYNTFFRNRSNGYGMTIQNGDNQNIVGNEITNYVFLYGNWSIAGSGHYLYGNSVKNSAGTYVLTPAATTSLLDTSLRYTIKPPFLSTIANWPVFGIANTPNTPNTNTIPAVARFASTNKTVCLNQQPLAITFAKPLTGYLNTNNYRVLNWVFTLSSTYNKLEIERQINGADFTKIKTINNQGKFIFEETDSELIKFNTVTYRLKILEEDGTFAYSNSVNIINSPTSNIQIIPNVCSSFVSVNGLSIDKNYKANILSMDGKIVLSAYINITNNNLDISSLANGIYIINIISEDGSLLKSRFVKQ